MGPAVTSRTTNLAGRNSWLICLGAVTILCSLTLWNAWSDYDSTLREAQSKRDTLARIAETNLASNFTIVDRFLSQIAANCDTSPLDSPAIQQNLRLLLPLIPDAISIAIADKNGILVSATDPNAQGANVSTRSYFAYPMHHPESSFFISEPFDTITNKRVMVISRLIRNADGSPRGVIGIAIRPEFVTNTLLAAQPGPSGSVVLFAKDYIIRSRIPDDVDTVGKSLKGLPVTEQFLSSSSQVAHYRVQATLDGKDRFVTFRQMVFPDNLVLTISDSADEVLTAWAKKSIILVILTLAGSVLIILLAFTSNRSLSAAARADAALVQRDLLFGTVLKNLPVKVCAHDVNGNVIYQSESCKIVTNGISDHPINNEVNQYAVLQSWHDKKERALAGKATTNQYQLHLPSGECRLIESYSGPIIDGETIIGVIGVDIDVTDYKNIEAQLLKALSEKDVMLKEIHHRVKNNLQIIMSLISLQNYSCTDDNANSPLTQTYERIRTIALVHEHLYKSCDVGFVHIADYIPNLVHKISTTFRRDGLTVSSQVNVQDIKLNIDKAIPLGLVVNELTMNAFKHAFTFSRDNILSVTFHHYDSGLAELVVSDNGPGLPDSYDVDSEATLGMRLVNNLVQQLKGTLHYTSEKGACFRIIVPVQETCPPDPGT